MEEPKRSKRKLKKPTLEELIKRDARALAQLIYNIYQEKKDLV